LSDPQIPLCSSAEVCNAQARAGFEPQQHSRGGSHQKWRKRTEERTFVAVVVLSKKEIPRGTLKSIIAQAGMTVEEFIGYLR
jgi:predicted RNA binding protein YcfA (HicA-like mRNA interferase family)